MAAGWFGRTVSNLLWRSFRSTVGVPIDRIATVSRGFWVASGSAFRK
jgi:hypothetical protein